MEKDDLKKDTLELGGSFAGVSLSGKKTVLTASGVVIAVVAIFIGTGKIVKVRHRIGSSVLTPTATPSVGINPTPSVSLKVWKTRVSLQTNTGPVVMLETEQQGTDGIAAVEGVKTKVYSLFANAEDALFYLTGKQLYRFDKTSKVYSKYVLEGLPDRYEPAVTTERLDGTHTLVRVYDRAVPSGETPYFLNISSNQIWRMEGQWCGAIYCGGPTFAGQADAEQYVLVTGAGDACWSSGEVYLYDARTRKTKLIMKYGRGCTADEFYYVGFADKKVVIAKRKVQNGEIADRDLFISLHAIDPLSGEVETLLPENTFPKDISDIRFNGDKTVSLINDRRLFYGFDLVSKKLIVPFPTPTQPPNLFEPTREQSNAQEVQKYFSEHPEVMVYSVEER